MQQGPAASTGDRSRSSAGRGWGRHRGAPRPRGGRAGTGPAGWGHTGRTASPAPPCGGHSRRVHGGLSGACQVQGTELLSRGPDKEWPWPRADPSLHRETGHSSGTRTGRKAGSWPLVPAGTLPAGAAGGRTPLAGTHSAPRAGPPLLWWPLHPRIPSLDTALPCWPLGAQSSPRGRVAASAGTSSPWEGQGERPQVSRQRAHLGPLPPGRRGPLEPRPPRSGL